jgi:hypothetical protein
MGAADANQTLPQQYEAALELPAALIHATGPAWETITTDTLDGTDALRSPVLNAAAPEARIRIVVPEPGRVTFSWRTEDFSWNMRLNVGFPNGLSRTLETRDYDDQQLDSGWRSFTQQVSTEMEIVLSATSWFTNGPGGRVVVDQVRFVPASGGGPAPALLVEGGVSFAAGSGLSWKIPSSGASPLVYGAENLPPGMTLNPATGVISSPQVEWESRDVKLSVTNAQGAHFAMLHVAADAIAAYLSPGSGSGLHTVLRSNAMGHFPRLTDAGMDSTGSFDKGESYYDPPAIETSVTGPATIRWYYMADSSRTSQNLRPLTIDGVPQAALLPRVGQVWHRVDTPVPAGPHTLRWLLTEELAIDGIAHVEAGAPQLEGPTQFTVPLNIPFSLPVPTNRPATFTSSALPSGVTLNSSTGVLSGTVTMPGAYHFTLSLADAVNPAGSSMHVVTLLAMPPVLPASGLVWRQELTQDAVPFVPTALLGSPDAAVCSFGSSRSPLRMSSLVTEVTGPLDVIIFDNYTTYGYAILLDDTQVHFPNTGQRFKRLKVPAGAHSLRLLATYGNYWSASVIVSGIKTWPAGLLDTFPYGIRAETGFGTPAQVPLQFDPRVQSWSLSGFPATVSRTAQGLVQFYPVKNETLHGFLNISGAFGSVSLPWYVMGTAPIVPLIGDAGLRWWMIDGPQGGWALQTARGEVQSIGAPCGTLATKVTGPAHLEFSWELLRQAPLAALDFSLDGVTQRFTTRFLNDLKRETVDIPAGEHVVKFFYPDATGDLRLSNVRVWEPSEPRIVIRQGGGTFTYTKGQWFQLDLLSEPPADSWSLAGILPEGLHFNASTGSIYGIPTRHGVSTIQVTAYKDDLQDRQRITLGTLAHSQYAQPIPAENSAFVNDAVTPWSIIVDGNGAWASVSVQGAPSILTLQIEGPDTLIFDSAYDGVEFQLDDGPYQLIAAQRHQVAIPAGTHQVRWKRANGLATISQIGLVKGLRPLWAATSDLEVTAGVPFSIPLTLYGQFDQVSLRDAPIGLSLQANPLALIGTILIPGDYRPVTEVAHGSNSDRNTLRLKVTAPLVPVPALSGALNSPSLSWSTSVAPVAGWRNDSVAGAVGGTAAVINLENEVYGVRVTMETTVVGGQSYSLRWKNVDALYGYKDGATTPELVVEYLGSPDWQEFNIPLAAGTWRIVFAATYSGRAVGQQVVDYFVPTPAAATVAPVLSGVPNGITCSAGVSMQHQFISLPSTVTWAATGLPPGLSLNANTGLLSGTPTASGIFSANVTASNANGTGSLTVGIDVRPDLATAMDAPGLTWTVESWEDFYGDVMPIQPYHLGWIGTSQGAWDGEDAVSIDPLLVAPGERNILGQAATTLRTTISGPCTVQFRCRLGPGDGRLRSGTTYLYTGDNLWRTVTATIPAGEQEFEIVYDYDEGDPVITPGQQVWLDDFRLSTDGRPMINEAVVPAELIHGAAFSLAFSLVTPDASAVWSATGLPPGLTINSATGILSGAPIQAGTFPARILVNTAAGSASLDIPMKVSTSFPDALGLPGIAWTASSPYWRTGSSGMDSNALSYSPYPSNTPGTLSATIQGPDTLSFWYYLSTGSTANPQASVSVDGVTTPLLPASSYLLREIVLGPGAHTVTFTASHYFVLDQMRLDSLNVPRFGAPWPAKLPYTLFEPFDAFLPIRNGPATVTLSGLPAGLSYDAATSRISGIPTGYLFGSQVNVSNQFGSTVAFMEFEMIHNPRHGMELPLDLPVEVPYSESAISMVSNRPTGDVTRLRKSDVSGVLQFYLTGPATVAVSHQSSNANYRILRYGVPIAQFEPHPDWRRAIFDIPAGESILAFHITSGYGSELFLDDFRISHLRAIAQSPENWPLLPGANTLALVNRGTPGVWNATGLPPGFVIHPTTGVLTGNFLTGSWDATITLTDEIGPDSFPLRIQGVQLAEIADALDCRQSIANWTSVGFWGEVDSNAWLDGDSVRATLPAGQPASQPATVTTTVAGPGNIAWVWKGTATAFIDGVSVLQIANVADWQPSAFDLTPGVHTIEFRTLTSASIDALFLTGFARWSAALPLTSRTVNSDEDGDGFTLFEEYAWGRDPLRPTGPPTSPLVFNPNGPVGTTILDWLTPDLPVEWRVQSSCDLTNWGQEGLNIERIGSRLRVRTTQPTGSRCFLRLWPAPR